MFAGYRKHRMRSSLAGQNHQETGDQVGLLLGSQVHHLFLRQHLQGHLHHADRAFYDLLPGRDDGGRLLPLEHRSGDLGAVSQVGEAGLNDLEASQVEPRLKFPLQGCRPNPF